MKAIKICFAVFMTIVFGYFIIGTAFFPKDAPDNNRYYRDIYEGTWEWLHDDGTVSLSFQNIPNNYMQFILNGNSQAGLSNAVTSYNVFTSTLTPPITNVDTTKITTV